MGNQDLVRKFHEKYGHVVGDLRDTPEPKVVALRAALMKEELVDELIPAMMRHDLEEIADGLADLLYVVYGTAVTYGIPLDEVFAEVHRSNMSKAVPPSKLPHEKYPKGWDPKGPGYQPPRVLEVLQRELLRHR